MITTQQQELMTAMSVPVGDHERDINGNIGNMSRVDDINLIKIVMPNVLACAP